MSKSGLSRCDTKRREFDYVTCHITNPGLRPITPDIPPNLGIAPSTNLEYVENEYFPRYLMSDEKAPEEQYTYGERLLVSMDKVIQMLKRSPGTNQAILQVGRPEDVTLSDPPCLRHIDCRAGWQAPLRYLLSILGSLG